MQNLIFADIGVSIRTYGLEKTLHQQQESKLGKLAIVAYCEKSWLSYPPYITLSNII